MKFQKEIYFILFCVLITLFTSILPLQAINFENGRMRSFSNYKSNQKDTIKKKVSIGIEFQYLNTTHITPFPGINLVASYHLKSFLPGIAIEYTHSNFHNDNEWKLYNLNFIPVFLDLKYIPQIHKFVNPFFDISMGLTFMKYQKEERIKIGHPYHVKEKGFFLYGGCGLIFNISNKVKATTSLGFKGFHMSNNDLDVNPHGTTIKIGMLLLIK